MKKILYILIISIIFYNIYLSYINWFKTDSFKIFFFDVGQGDSILIVAPGGKTVLIDGGPDDKVLRELGKVLPFWRKQIDLMVITHAHDDHLAGLISVNRHYLVKQVVYNNLNFKNPVVEELNKKLKDNKSKLMVAKENLSFNFVNNCVLKILSANKDVSLDENDYSIVTSFNCLNKKILLTGDAGKFIEESLLNQKINIRSDILKISHHGSVSASSELFIKTINPEVAIISVGKNNKFKHPNLAILERLKKLNVDIYRTDGQGTIGFFANNKEIILIK